MRTRVATFIVIACGLLVSACGSAPSSEEEPSGSAAPLPSSDRIAQPGTWSAQQAVAGFTTAERVSCAGPAFCLAVGFAADAPGKAIAYSGAGWGSPQSLGSGGEGAVSCPIPGTCYILNGRGSVVELSQGRLYPPANVDSGKVLDTISCAGVGSCVALDNSAQALIMTDGVWASPSSIGTPDSYWLSCTMTGFCLAIDDDGDAYIYSGGRWTRKDDVDTDGAPTDVSCGSPQLCVIVDDHGNALVYDGSWTDPVTVDQGQVLTAVSCSSGGLCVAGDIAGNALEYSAGQWTYPKQVLTTRYGISSVSCTLQMCMAVSSAAAAVYKPS